MYCDIVDCIQKACKPLCKDSKKHYNCVPGWNEHVKDSHDMAREAFSLWQSFGKPRYGPIFQLMTSTRLSFKYALRRCRLEDEQYRADALANKLTSKDMRGFWNGIKQENNKHIPLSQNVNGATGSFEIAQMWKEHFNSLLNSVSNTKYKESVQDYVKDCMFTEDAIITVDEMLSIIKSLNNGKAADCDGLVAEHLKFAPHSLIILLSMVLSSMLVHGIIPKDFTRVTLVPILKSKTGDLTDKDNYRPIAITSILSKVMDKYLLNCMEDKLLISDHQFGFKRGHSTDMCLFIFKEIISFYVKHGSPVFACFLDVRKAFDRVNHWTLLYKLIQNDIPNFIIRFLMCWFDIQVYCIKWGQFVSSEFRVSNGVRQGGILSPYLFNFYINDLNIKLADANVGCQLNGTSMNNFSYADDMCVISPSVAGLRKLLSICEEYASEHDIIFNAKKSMCMIFKTKTMKIYNMPKFYLSGNVLEFVDEFKYLGHMVCSDLNDDCDIKRQYQSICRKVNMLKRKFYKCSIDVKIQLFQSYCMNVYCVSLWSTHHVASLKRMQVMYNNAFRIIMGYEYNCSASNMFVSNRVLSFKECMRKSMFGLFNRLKCSDNSLVNSVLSSDLLFTSKLLHRWYDELYVNI